MDRLAFGEQLRRAFCGGIGFLGRASRGRLGAFARFGGLGAFARLGHFGSLAAGGGAFFAFTGLQRNSGERNCSQTNEECFHTYFVVN